MSAVQFLIADDHELFRRTLRSFIESQPDWHVCGEAGDGVEAIVDLIVSAWKASGAPSAASLLTSRTASRRL